MPPLPTPPTMENEEYNEEEVAEQTSVKNLTVLSAINKIVTRSQAKKGTDNRAAV